MHVPSIRLSSVEDARRFSPRNEAVERMMMGSLLAGTEEEEDTCGEWGSRIKDLSACHAAIVQRQRLWHSEFEVRMGKVPDVADKQANAGYMRLRAERRKIERELGKLDTDVLYMLEVFPDHMASF